MKHRNLLSEPLLLLIFLFIATPSIALTVKPFQPSQPQQEIKQKQDDYRLVLSSLGRVQATTVPEHEVRLKGDLWRRTWSVESQYSLAEVINHFAPQFNELRTLYECKALDCGSNNFWANTIFNNARLTGRDKFQYYRVALQQEANNSKIYVLYISERGTKQVMVNLDILSSPQRFNLELNTPSYIRQQLKSQAGWLAGFFTQNNQLDSERSQALINTLKALPQTDKSRLFLHVHCYQGERMADTIACSETLATQLQEQLGTGFNIQSQGASVLSPEGKQPALRFIYWPNR